MPYLQLIVEAPEDRVEELSLALHDAGSAGVEIREAGIKPIPGARMPPPGRALLIAWFESTASAEEAREALKAEPAVHVGEVEPVVEEDWSESWKSRVRPVSTTRLWVGPPWLSQQAHGKIAVIIEPGMAFGTGDHPTTLACLEFLDRALAASPRASVLDVGTGSGVLAIAAARLGSARIVGVDNDPVAVKVALENAQLNSVPGVSLSTLPVQQVEGVFDVVVANILANTLVELAEPIAAKVARGGSLVLAGILSEQAPEVQGAYLEQGLAIHPEQPPLPPEWAMLGFVRP